MELDSVQSILLWHIATEICYYSHHKNKAFNHSISLLQDTKLLSNYLAYLLAYRQSLFSNGVGRTRFEATVIDTKDFLRRHVPILLGRVEHAYEYVLEDLELRVGCRKDVKELGVGSVLNYGFLLAKELQRLEENERWEMMSHEWVELLAKVACECKFYDHIEQLGHGGDLLTHVWLLMHHIGYTKQAYDVTNARDEQIQEFRRVLKRRRGGGSSRFDLIQP